MRRNEPAKRPSVSNKVTQSNTRKAASKGTTTRKASVSANGTRSASHSKSTRTDNSRGQAASKADVRSRSGANRQKSSAKGKSKSHAAPKRTTSIFAKAVTSKPVIIAVIIVGVLLLGGVVDAAANWGRAYGNVSINGLSVSGMTSEEIQSELRTTFGPRVSQAKVTIYASEEAQSKGRSTLEELEAAAIADQVSYEEAIATNDWWQTDALSLKATLPFERVAEEAIALGRSDGGMLKRFELALNPQDLELELDFDESALDSLAASIDETIGDERKDASVYVEGNTARAVVGHDGMMVDREWLAGKISDSMIRDDVPDSFVAVTSPAASRITMEQAEEMCEVVKRAISTSAVFSYHGKKWTAEDAELGNWTVVETVPDGDGYKLEPSINSEIALPAIVKGTDAAITNDGTTVEFERSGDDFMVKTSGSGEIPEVLKAVESLDEALYGSDGIAWENATPEMISVEIGDSEMPDELPFDQALDLGIVSVIGEYTTEFSNYEGTENRNHNIKLAADILDGGIIEADGGIWDFNTESGDTNEEAGFWSAGSIIDGEYQDSIGGGICQVATTIFNAVYEGGLDVVERHNHSLYIASYPTGRDASVSYPELNFTWKNTLPSDILMRLSYTDSSLTAELYSVYTGYYAETETGAWEEGEKYKTRFETDESLGEGAYYLKTSGEDGSKISVTRTVYDDDDKVVSTTLFESVYEPKDEVYIVGSGVDTSNLARNTSGSSGSSVSSSSDSSYSDSAASYADDYGYDDEGYDQYV